MPDEATNAFEIFSSQSKGHENHLTRALLVLLRHSPLAHEVWLRAIGLGGIGLTGVGEARYRFQTSAPDLLGLEPDESLRGISVFISREPAVNLGPIAASSDQKMIPDGLVSYADPAPPIVVVIESKVHDAVDAGQARQINLGEYRPAWEPAEPVALRWSTLIDELWLLLDLDLAGGSEAALLSDFFDFVDAHYRSVGPYGTLRRCGEIEERIRRRCRTILAEATAREAHGPARGSGPYVEMEGPASLPRRVAFDREEGGDGLRLSFWPADTPNQARAFYGDPELLERVASLIDEDGWGAAGNMHFGHFERGYAWSEVPDGTSIGQYFAFWREHPELIGTVYEPPRQPDWNELLQTLEAAQIIASREPFERDYVNTGRTKADVRPGIELYRWWDLNEATKLDELGGLVGEVRGAFERVLETFAPSSS
jgi:hypothetical protein